MMFAAFSAEQYATIEVAAADPEPAAIAFAIEAYAARLGLAGRHIRVLFASAMIAAEQMRDAGEQATHAIQKLTPILDDFEPTFYLNHAAVSNPRAPIPERIRRRASGWRE